MHTHYVLIDFENVQPASLGLLDQNHFKVLVFVGASQAKVPFEIGQLVRALQAKGLVTVTNNKVTYDLPQGEASRASTG